MDKSVVLAKLESLRRCIERVETKCPASALALREDADAQDIVTLNLERAVQVCVDIGSHLLGDFSEPVPSTMGDVFRALAKHGMLDSRTADHLAKAVGFRNIAVHAYQEIDWAVVYSIATKDLADFRAFAVAMAKFAV